MSYQLGISKPLRNTRGHILPHLHRCGPQKSQLDPRHIHARFYDEVKFDAPAIPVIGDINAELPITVL